MTRKGGAGQGRRAPDPRFVRKLFLPMLDHWLTSELGEDARIFFDADDIEAGQSWPQRLADGVASSKVMVCL